MNLTDEISSVVGKSAPLLGSVLGSPLAGIAISLVSSIFHANTNDIKDILDKIKDDPEASLKLKTLELQHQESLQKILATNYQTEVDDRKSARAREVALHDHVPTLLAFLFLICYAVVQVYAVMHPTNVNDIISARLQDILVMVFSYYFGSMHKDRWRQKS